MNLFFVRDCPKQRNSQSMELFRCRYKVCATNTDMRPYNIQ
jgi:hypothetical protein